MHPDFTEGQRHHKAGQLVDAQRHYLKALSDDPDDVSLLYHLGLVQHALNDNDRALINLEKAHQLHPNGPNICHSIAIVLRSIGNISQAREFYEKAFRLNPALGQAYNGYAEITRFSHDNIECFIEPVERSIAKATATQSAGMHFALGKALHDVEEYDRAFQHFSQGNINAAVDYDASKDESRVKNIIETYTPTYMASRNDGFESNVPIFIVGLPRSGSTLTEQILSSHSSVAGVGEDLAIMQLSKSLGKQAPTPREWPLCMPQYDNSLMNQAGRRYVDRLYQLVDPEKNKLRIVDKQLMNFYYLGLITEILPDATIIQMHRDPMDTCLSMYMRYFSNGMRFSFDLDNLGRYYKLHSRAMAHWHEVLPDRIHRVVYEDLVANQEEKTREMIRFSNLDWEDECLNYQHNEKVVKTASVWQVRQPLYKSSIGYWKKYEKHLGPLIRHVEEIGSLD